ncbi:MAG: polysaccharide pyruvyl transferase family protein, partial [Bdellovibrionales bacterium]|nr:polysaccharide pyruvyl transferase family protein [Bdellovibrionales bacterium]
EGSLKVIHDIGAKDSHCILTADAALNCPQSDESRVDEILSELSLDGSQDILAININQYLDTWASEEKGKLTKADFINVFAEAINSCIQELQVPLLFVSTQHHDLAMTQELASKIHSKKQISIIDNKKYNHVEIKGVLSRVSLLFGMRLHAMILGSSALAPIAGLAYQPKCTFYFEQLGIEQHIYNFDNFGKEKIAQAIMKAWQDRAAIKSTLTNKMPELKNNALVAGQIVAEILKGNQFEASKFKEAQVG